MQVTPRRFFPVSLLPWLAGLGVALAYLARFTTATADPDLFAYLSFGRLLRTSLGAGLGFPWRDVFSYLPVKDLLVYHEWLTGGLFFLIHETFGGAGLQAFRLAALAATLWLLWRTAALRAERTGCPGRIAALAALAGLYLTKDLLRIGYAPVRAQIITFLFFALTIHLLERDRLADDRMERPAVGWSPLWLMVPACLVWGNLHAGFPAGLGLIVLYGLAQGLTGRPWGRHAAVLAASVLATLVNPYGPATWGFAVEGSLVPWREIEIDEWRSIFQLFTTDGYRGLYLLFLVLAGVAAALALPVLRRVLARRPDRRPPDLAALLVLGVTAWLGLTRVRHVVLFGLAFCAYVPAMATGAWAELSRARAARRAQGAEGAGVAPGGSRRAGALAALLVLLLLADGSVAAFLAVSRQHPLDLRAPSLVEAVALSPGDRAGFHYPVGAVDFIRRNGLRGKILTDFAWGNYVTWELYPSCLVAIDNRCGLVYPDRLFEAYFDLHYLRDGWRVLLDDYPPDMVILEANSLVGARLAATGEWRTAYRDPGCELLLRRTGPLHENTNPSSQVSKKRS
jgi:hypothetical protein